MGNAFSRPSCLGQKSKHVKSEEDFLKECYQRKKECPLIESWSAESVKEKDSPDVQSPTKDQLQSAGIAGSASAPASAQASPNLVLSKQNDVEICTQPNGRTDQRHSITTTGLQRLSSGSPWPWKSMATREVTEVTEVTETIVTEIVEVVEYPSSDKRGEPIITRTVRVLSATADELSQVNTITFQLFWVNSDKKYQYSIADMACKMVNLADSEDLFQNLEPLLVWVSDIEELAANQRPPSSEVKVVKAQLQEQKLLQRLLEERRPSLENMIENGPLLLERDLEDDHTQTLSKIAVLKQRWETLLLTATDRFVHLLYSMDSIKY
uniref:Uncharacterized protein n=1 Tax=Erpetoichthys calabaricus TaxID=27687 RepID=A0A8C4SNF0_ERPCA